MTESRAGPLRRRWPRNPWACVLSALLAAAAIGCTMPVPTGTVIGDPTAPPRPPSPVEGIVVEVTAAGLGQVERFNLRLPDGTTIVLQMGSLENAAEFPPSHLAEHQATSEPIRAYYRIGPDGDPDVYRLEDAAEP